MTDDLDDLLGETAPPAAAGRRPRLSQSDAAARLEKMVAEKDDRPDLPHPSEFHKPVSVSYLAKVAGMDPNTVASHLTKCPVAEWEKAGPRGGDSPRYNFMTAIAYLVPPQMDIERYILSLTSSSKQNQIPASFSKLFFDGLNARDKWAYNAKQTWRDEDVLEVLGETAMMIRDVSLLWVEELPSRVTMTTADYNAMRAQVTDLLEQIKEKLVDLPNQRKTESVYGLEIDSIMSSTVGGTQT